MPVLPIARGMILCERVRVDPHTQNVTLDGWFRAMRADRFPAVVIPFYAFAHLVNGLGDVRIRVDVVRQDTHELVIRSAGMVAFGNRLNDVRFQCLVPRIAVAGPGAFEVTLWAGDEPIAQTDFRVLPPRE